MTQTVEPTRKQYLIPLAIQLLPAGLAMIGLPLLKESPRWLYSRGQHEKAKKNLAWIRKLPMDHPYLQEEIKMMESQDLRDRTLNGTSFFGTFKGVFGVKHIFLRLCFASSLFLLQNGSGANAINYVR
jgi:hypothetical protein